MTDARPSSTVILSRAGDAAPEFLLVERVNGGAFGGAHVFPGGVLEDIDHATTAIGVSDTHANRVLGLESGARAYYSAAARELFEETSILLTDTNVPERERLAMREALLEKNTSWSTLLREKKLALTLEQLRYVSFWVTPRSLPRRFATRFFFAISPGGQGAVACGRELQSAEWLTADDALQRASAGRLILHPPTLLTLKELRKHHSIEALTVWAVRREQRGVARIEPVGTDPRDLQQAMDAMT